MNAAKFLDSLVNYEKIPSYNYDLNAYRKFLEKLGAPHKKLKNVILIAGTKGKGSTAAILNSCLIAHGYKVGLYTSPHLKKINERIKIDNREISNRELNKYVSIIKPHVNLRTRIGARTFFEVLTTIAFMHFVRHNLDFTILEVGLGGRLDATNVTEPLFSVITRIGYDHTNLLGKTLAKIAFEKAGIIRRNTCPSPCVGNIINKACSPVAGVLVEGEGRVRGGNNVVTIHQRPSVERILIKAAGERNNRLIFAESQHKVKIDKMSLQGSIVRVRGKLGRFSVRLPLVGKHQTENLLIALTVLNELRKVGFKIDLPLVKKGIEKTRLPGRFEIISKKPLVIFDVAHNEDSFRALDDNLTLLHGSCHCEGQRPEAISSTPSRVGIAALPTVARNDKKDKTVVRRDKRDLCLIFGCSQDKDIAYAIKRIFPKAREVLLVKANHPRAMEPAAIYERAKRFQKKIVIAGTVKRALAYIKARNEDNPMVLVFGSFYLYCKNTRE